MPSHSRALEDLSIAQSKNHGADANYMKTPSQFIKDHTAHLKQITALSVFIEELAYLSAQIDVETHPSLNYLIQRIQIRHFFLAINEFNETICHAISNGNYSPAEALARTSIEMSVNLLFILGGDRHARSKGLLLACFASRKSKAKKWETFAASVGLMGSKEAASQLLSETEALERAIVSSSSEPSETWPKKSWEKFKMVGHEESYQTCFRSTSDSVHLLGEDILNLTLCHLTADEDRKANLVAITSEKASFAIFLLIQAVLLQCEAVMGVIHKTNDYDEQATAILHIATQVQSMHKQHEEDCQKYRKQT